MGLRMSPLERSVFFTASRQAFVELGTRAAEGGARSPISPGQWGGSVQRVPRCSIYNSKKVFEDVLGGFRGPRYDWSPRGIQVYLEPETFILGHQPHENRDGHLQGVPQRTKP